MKNFTWRIAAWVLIGMFTTQPSSPNNFDPIKSIIGTNSRVEKLTSGFKFTEGPIWERRGFLLFSDIGADSIYKLTNNQIKTFRHPAGHANGNTLDRQGRLITAEHDRRLVRTEQDGTISILAERYQGKRLNSPNDVVVKSDGSIYFTDPPYGVKKEQEELGFYGVYRLTPNRTLTLLSKDMVRPNGLAFSPDESKLYVSDSEKGQILVFQVKTEGTLTNGQVFAQLKEPSKEGVPDGMKVDVQGNIYCSGPGGVWIFSPNGQLLSKISVPEVVTNLAWGNLDYKTLYITASTSIYRIQLKIAGMQPGRVLH